MTLREYAKLMNDTALQGSLSNEEYNRLYPQSGNPSMNGVLWGLSQHPRYFQKNTHL